MLGRLAVLPLRSLPETRMSSSVNYPGYSRFESSGFLYGSMRYRHYHTCVSGIQKAQVLSEVVQRAPDLVVGIIPRVVHVYR